MPSYTFQASSAFRIAAACSLPSTMRVMAWIAACGSTGKRYSTSIVPPPVLTNSWSTATAATWSRTTMSTWWYLTAQLPRILRSGRTGTIMPSARTPAVAAIAARAAIVPVMLRMVASFRFRRKSLLHRMRPRRRPKVV
jgi:hypothetical protein